MKVAAILLAGGRGTRMGGGDKPLRQLGGKPLLAHAIDRIRPQVQALALNANGDPMRFAEYGLPVVADEIEGFAGPLAGILSGLVWAAANAPDSRWLLSVPTDSPFLPHDMVLRMLEDMQARGAELACAASGGHTHPVVGLWPLAIAADLRRALVEEDIRKIDRFTARYEVAAVEWPTSPIDPFFNANSPEELAEAERLLASL